MNKNELKAILESYPKLKWEYVEDKDVFIVSPDDLKKSTKWGEFQFKILKPVSAFNQRYKCICGNGINYSQLHHAILSRNDVRGCKGFAKIGIHHSLNTFEVCEACNPHPTRKEGAIYLAEIYGKDRIIEWYNSYPMRTRTFRIEYFLD